jgi:hypothetical protein
MMRDEAEQYRSNYGLCMPISMLADRVSAYLHGLTVAPDTRPLAISGVIASKSSLVKVECDGNYGFYRTCSTDTGDLDEDMAVSVAVQRLLVQRDGEKSASGGRLDTSTTGQAEEAKEYYNVPPIIRDSIGLTVSEAAEEVTSILQSVSLLPNPMDVSDRDVTDSNKQPADETLSFTVTQYEKMR